MEIFHREAELSAQADLEETPDCATVERLVGYLKDRLDGPSRVALEDHLGLPCPYCLRALAELYRGLEQLK
jgi:hypothetical protein